MFTIEARIAGAKGVTFNGGTEEYTFSSLIDTNATTETIALHNYLISSMGSHINFGVALKGSGEKVDSTRESYKITGKHPKIYYCDYRYPSATQKASLVSFAESGGIVGMQWHADNFVTGGSYLDTSGSPVTAILPGGSKRTEYLAALDVLATWMLDFKDSQDNLIPILWRPFHEVDIGAFWWGAGGTPEQFKELWRDMVVYLRDTKGVHNLIWVYSPEILGTHKYDGDYYPGDEYIDVMGIDRYSNSGFSSVSDYYRQAYLVAKTRHKVFAITEGLKNQALSCQSDYWTNTLDQIVSDKYARNAAYFVVWNAVDGGWGPLQGRCDEFDFVEFSNRSEVVFN